MVIIWNDLAAVIASRRRARRVEIGVPGVMFAAAGWFYLSVPTGWLAWTHHLTPAMADREIRASSSSASRLVAGYL